MIQYLCARLLIEFCRLIPFQLQLHLFAGLSRLVLVIKPKYRRVVLRNIEIVFPEYSEEQRLALAERSHRALARTLADSLRVSKLNSEWFRQNVTFPQIEELEHILSKARPCGVIGVGGHLGSFELIPSAIAAHTGIAGKIIAREFKNTRLNTWWNDQREAHGVTVIPRSGALRKMLRAVHREGDYVGVLFDQNVTRNLATFVSWFGIPAATTVAVGLCAVRVQAPIVVVSIFFREDDKYELVMREVETQDVFENEALTFDEKVFELNQRTVDVFCKLLRQQPEGWFWMHRRWKTRPKEEDPSIYDD